MARTRTGITVGMTASTSSLQVQALRNPVGVLVVVSGSLAAKLSPLHRHNRLRTWQPSGVALPRPQQARQLSRCRSPQISTDRTYHQSKILSQVPRGPPAHVTKLRSVGTCHPGNQDNTSSQKQSHTSIVRLDQPLAPSQRATTDSLLGDSPSGRRATITPRKGNQAFSASARSMASLTIRCWT
jgi:hypothetical protein